MIKLNLGASPIWTKKGWHTLDHKLTESSESVIAGTATNINLPDESCQIVFCSHVFEHIPHIELPSVISEINRILCVGGVLRILTPDLKVIAKAYIEQDEQFFERLRDEDESIRTDLGLGGMFMNFIVSPGQDTVLINRGLNKFIAGYAHVYSYDYEMLKIILDKLGFLPRKVRFCESNVSELTEPLHVIGMEPKWQNFNQNFYSKNGLIHRMIDGKYEINFKVTGFDRDPTSSLIIEAVKQIYVNRQTANQIFNRSSENYNRYSKSLLSDINFVNRLKSLEIEFEPL